MGQHVVITGASSGIGAALARELGRRGHSVGLLARRAEKLDELAESMRAEGAQVATASADVTDRQALLLGIRTLEEALGPCEILVANAGIGGRLDPTKWDAQPNRKVFEVNYFGAMNAVEVVIGGMLERRSGQLVVISSVAATRGLPPAGPYSASKAAISTMWEALRVQLAPHGVSCLTVHPGFVKTPLTDKNDFDMPFLVPAETAAGWIADAIRDRRRELTFPWQMALVRWFMKRVPEWLFDRVIGRR